MLLHALIWCIICTHRLIRCSFEAEAAPRTPLEVRVPCGSGVTACVRVHSLIWELPSRCSLALGEFNCIDLPCPPQASHFGTLFVPWASTFGTLFVRECYLSECSCNTGVSI